MPDGVPAAGWGLPAMLSAYRVIDATDHRGQLAGMILAGLGAEVVLAEPPGGAAHRHRGDGLEFWAYNRGKHSVVCRDRRRRARPRARRRRAARQRRPLRPRRRRRGQPGRRPRHGQSAFGRDGPKADWAASDLTILAAGCSQALNGDSDRPPVRTSVPQAWLHAGAEAAVGALLALTERATSGRGQHVDVSAQQAVLQAAIPGVLLAPNDNPEAQRTSGGILTGPIHLQFVYPAADGYVSITLLFGSMIGPFTRRLMEWVCEEGHCTAAMRDWDWNAFGLRLATTEEGAGELEDGQGGDHRDDEPAHQGRAVRRGAAAPRAAGAGDDAGRARGDGAPARARATGTTSTGATCPGPFVQVERRSPADARRAAGGRRAHAGAAPRRHGRRSDASAGPTGALPLDGLKVVDLTWVFAGPLATRVLADFGATVVKVEGPTHPDATRGGGGVIKGDLGARGQRRVRPLQRRQAGPQPRPLERGRPRRAARPRPLGRRARRVVHAGRDGGVGPRLRVAAGDQPAASSC